MRFYILLIINDFLNRLSLAWLSVSIVELAGAFV
jgi:hypothetical protein